MSTDNGKRVNDERLAEIVKIDREGYECRPGAPRWAEFSERRVIGAELLALRASHAELVKALEELRDCDWVISLPDRMDAVRKIARDALENARKVTA